MRNAHANKEVVEIISRLILTNQILRIRAVCLVYKFCLPGRANRSSNVAPALYMNFFWCGVLSVRCDIFRLKKRDLFDVDVVVFFLNFDKRYHFLTDEKTVRRFIKS